MMPDNDAGALFRQPWRVEAALTPDMFLAPRGGQFHLPLALGITGAILLAAGVKAMRAGNPCLKVRRKPVVGRQRKTTRPAKLGIAFDQPMRHRDPLVEDEAFALPQALRGRYLFEIFENAALEMKHFLDAERLHIGGR